MTVHTTRMGFGYERYFSRPTLDQGTVWLSHAVASLKRTMGQDAHFMTFATLVYISDSRRHQVHQPPSQIRMDLAREEKSILPVLFARPYQPNDKAVVRELRRGT